MISPEALHRAVKICCAERGLTIAVLCEQVRVNRSVLQPSRMRRKVENGSLGLPCLDVIHRLEGGLGLPPLGLLELALSIDEQLREAGGRTFSIYPKSAA